jgi:hypothetical protein
MRMRCALEASSKKKDIGTPNDSCAMTMTCAAEDRIEMPYKSNLRWEIKSPPFFFFIYAIFILLEANIFIGLR